MVEHLCRGGDAVSVVVCKAGTGKTFALGAARDGWQSAGLPVLGVAVARRAARELEQDAGIASTSVAALLRDLKSRGSSALPERCVLVVDEAGMVPTRQLAELVEATAAARGKLVVVGDHRQLPELEAGGAFRGLAQRGFAIELTDNHRQVSGWERSALNDLRDGRAEAAIAHYARHGRIAVDDTPERARERLVAEWWAAAGDAHEAVMLAQRRDDVADLNARAREHLRAAGQLGERELRLPGGRFAVGDHVIAKRNDLQRGVVNGERGRVVAVDLEGKSVTLDCHGERLTLDADYLYDRTVQGDPTLLHGHAMTVHVAQGLTVDHAFVLAGPGLNRELGYTALSRGRHTNRLYAARDPDTSRAEYAPADSPRDDPIARLIAQLGTSSAMTLAIDAGRGEHERNDSVAEATRLRAEATERRRAAEASHMRWLPGRRNQLAELRRAEALAAGRVDDLRRQQAERGHAARPFVTEHDLGDRAAQMRDQLAERRLQRERSRERGRGLER